MMGISRIRVENGRMRVFLLVYVVIKALAVSDFVGGYHLAFSIASTWDGQTVRG